MTMSLTVGRRAVGDAFIISVALAARSPVARPTHSPGLVYTATVVRDRQGVSGSPGADTIVSVEQFAGDDGRIDIRRMPSLMTHGADSLSRAFGTAAGVYTLRKRGRSTVTVVDTTKRHYFESNVDSAMRNMVRLGPQRELHAGDTVFTTRVQPDTMIDGLHLQHWRLTNNFTLRLAAVGAFPVRNTTDMYIATESNDMRFGSPGGATQPPLADYEYSRERKDATAKLPHGLDVLTITQTVVDYGPAHHVSTQTKRMSDIQYIDIPAEVFAIPAGYQRVAPPTVPSLSSPPVRAN